ncbi:MAG: HD domain-containing protein [Lachnospiraceae bacterium]|nr:HD domain-containing protein [Lachnospiraceae bacterium]
MKIITKMELEPGMILGEDVIYQDRVLFKKGDTCTNMMISQLKNYNVLCVTIMEDADFAVTHNEKLQFNQRFKNFKEKYDKCLTIYKGTMLSFIGTNRHIATATLIDIYNDIYSTIDNGSELLDFLYNLTSNDDELTYTQSLNAALLAGTFADWLKMNPEDKKILILCGFYYDIGKWNLPSEILWKPGKLTDDELRKVRSHPLLGYALVQRDPDLNEHVRNAVVMHHERFDGTGYPYKMTGNKIDIFARYIAIVDTYIAMASPRTYRDAFTPLQILGNFEENLEKYDVELLLPIMKNIADSQIGTSVLLNDGTIWEVLMINQIKLSKPILKNADNQFKDLMKVPEYIVRNV